METTASLLNLYINEPSKALRRMSDSRPVGFILAVYAASMFSFVLGWNIYMESTAASLGPALTSGFVFFFGMGIAKMFLVACLFHFLAGWFGQGGSAKSCFLLLMMNCSPFALFTPLVLLLAPLESGLVLLALLLIGVMWFVLNIRGLQENYRMGVQAALFTVLSPIILGLVSVAFFFGWSIFALIIAAVFS